MTVKPNARQSSVEQTADGRWLVRLTSPPVDGKANAELIRVLAEHLGVAKSHLTIASGLTSRHKKVIIDR